MAKPSVIESRVNDLIAGNISAAGYDLVRIHMSGNGKYAALQIMAERIDGKGMTADDCATISRAVSDKLGADKEFAGKFDLEVSSPGIDRPLIRLKDYTTYQGHVTKVELAAPIEGRKKFEGKIIAVYGEVVEFGLEKTSIRVPFDAIAQAKLVLTDALLKTARDKVSH